MGVGEDILTNYLASEFIHFYKEMSAPNLKKFGKNAITRTRINIFVYL